MIININKLNELKMSEVFDVLPIEALPTMYRLMTYFNKALAEAVKLYKKKDVDFKQFQKEFIKYENDLELFDRSFKIWLKSSETSKIKQSQLEELAPLFNEADLPPETVPLQSRGICIMPPS